MGDVEIRFTGDPHDAQSAALSIDAALEQIKKIADMVSNSLGDITIGRGQVAEVQSGSRVMAGAIADVRDRALETTKAVRDVKFGPGQAAGVVAQAAVMSAALDRVDASATRAQRHVDEVGRFQPSTMMAAFASGQPMNEVRRTFAAGPAGAGGRGVAYGPGGYAMTTIGPSPTDMGMKYGTGPDPRRTNRYFNDIPDPIQARYGNQGILSSYSDRNRGGMLGYLFGARGDEGGSRVGSILSGGFGGGASVGRRFGGFGGGGFGGGSGLGSIVPGGGRATGAAFGAAVGIAGTALSDVGPGAIGLLAPIASLGLSGSAAIGSLVIALGGLGKAIGGDKKAFDDLTPSAQRFVQTLRSLEPWADKMQEVVRSNLLPQLGTALHLALTPGTTSTIEKVLGQGARGTGAGAEAVGRVVGGQQFQRNLSGIGDQVERDIPRWSSITIHFTDAILGLTNAFGPLIDWTTKGIDGFSRLADRWVASTAAAHGFDSTMDAAKQGLQDAWLLVKSFGQAVFALGETLRPAGHEMIVLVSEGLVGLSNWLDQHRNEIQSVLVNGFDLLGKTLHIVVPVIGAAASGILTLADAVLKLSEGMGGLPAYIGAAVTALLLMSSNPEIKALLIAMAALGYLASGGAKDNFSGQMPGGTTDTNDITGKRLTNANEVLALRKKGWSDAEIQTYLSGDSNRGNKALKALPGLPQFGKGASGDIAMTSAFTDANALTRGQGAAGGVMPATSEAGNPASTLLQGPHHTDGFPGSGRTAVDIAARVGAPVLAPEDGRVTRDSGSAPKSGSNNINGYSLYYQGASGTSYFMTHMSWVAKPGAYKKGDKIGVIAAGTQGGAHLHVDYSPPVSMMGAKSSATSNPFGTAPPFDATTPTAWSLPLGMQTAIARAATTPGMGDDRKAIQAALKLLTPKYIGALSQSDQLLAYQQVASLQASLKGLKPVGQSTVASRMSGLNSAHSVMSLIGQALGPASGLLSGVSTNPGDILRSSPVADAESKYAGSLATWRKQITEFEKELREKTVSSSAVATIKTRIAAIKTNVQSALSEITDAARQQAQDFKSVWDTYVSSFDDAFKQTTSDVLAHPEQYPALLPLSAALADLRDSHTQQQLQQALSDAQKQLADALSGTSDPTGALQRAQDALGRDALAHALDVAQSKILGGIPGDMTAQIISDMQAALTAAGVPDPAAVEAAQKAVSDAQYDIKVDGLQKQASAEQTAYQQSRSELEKHLDAALALWGNYYAQSGMTAGQALASLNALLVKFGFSPIDDTFSPSTGNIPTPPTTGTHATADLIGHGDSVPGGRGGFAAGGLITSPHFIVDPSGNVVGQVGEGQYPELVVPVTPGVGAAGMGNTRAARSGGDGVTVNLQFANGMEWLKDFVAVEVKQNSGALNRKQGREADIRRRSGRF